MENQFPNSSQVSPNLSIQNLSGLIPTVSTAPTHIPRKFDEQFQVYKSGNESRFYWFDPVNAVWRYASATQNLSFQVVAPGTNTATGDGKYFFRIPESLNGTNLVGVAASVYTAGTTNTTDIQVRNKTDGQDMLSTKLTIDSGETDSSTAATPAVIDTTKDDVVTGDIIAIDVDAVSSTPAQGLYIQLTFSLP